MKTTWTKQTLRLSVALVVLGFTLGVVSISHAQRFIRPINSLPELVASNPNDPHTNVFIPNGPTGPGLFYQWRKNDGTTTNANQSVLGTDWPGASGRWHNIPIAQGSIDGISNSGTNGFAVVNTLDDLRNVPGDLGIGMVYVRGHSQPGDWGRGFFSRLDDCSIPDDDAYSIHGNTDSTCWGREADFPWAGIPVQYFGGTVSVATINRTLAFLSTLGGGIAFITDGAWPLATATEGPILGYNNVSLAGSSSALLVGDGTGPMLSWTNISNAGVVQVAMSNCTEAVVIRGGTNIVIAGNAISAAGDGVRLYGGDNVRVEKNIFDTVTNGIHLSLDGFVKVTQLALDGNKFSGVIGTNILEDAGATDGYGQRDSGAVLKLTQLLSSIQMGTNVVFRVGTGTPEGVVTADPSSLFLRRDTGDIYRKATGTGNTGWVVVGSSGPAFSDLVWTDNAGVVQLVTQTNRINFGNGTPGVEHFLFSQDIDGTNITRGIFANHNVLGADPSAARIVGLWEELTPAVDAPYNSSAAIYGISGMPNHKNRLLYDDSFKSAFGIYGEVYGGGSDPTNRTEGVAIFGVSDSVFSLQYGVVGSANSLVNSATNIGVGGSAQVNGQTGIHIGVYGEVASDTALTPNPVYVSAAGLFDNRDTGLPVFIARTNGVEVARIDGDGTVDVLTRLGVGTAANSATPLLVRRDGNAQLQVETLQNLNTGTSAGAQLEFQLSTSTGTAKNAASFTVEKAGTWTGTASTQDGRLYVNVASDGTEFPALTISPNTAYFQHADKISAEPTGVGLWMNTTHSASLGSQDYPPPIVFNGHAWNTGSSASQTVNISEFLRPIQGNPVAGARVFTASINGGGPVEILKVSTAGNVTFTVGAKLYLDEPANVFITSGTGTPEGALTAGISSTFHRKDGGAVTSYYVKESGTGNTGWVGK